jgi:hypothetical protein
VIRPRAAGGPNAAGFPPRGMGVGGLLRAVRAPLGLPCACAARVGWCAVPPALVSGLTQATGHTHYTQGLLVL